MTNEINASDKTALLKRITDTTVSERSAAITKELKETMGDFLNTKYVLPESIFISDFLNMFNGENTEYLNEKLNAWYLISNGPFNPVDLIDKDGKVVAVVPPVLHRDILLPQFNTNSNISILFKQYQAMLSISPVAADSILNESLHKSFRVDIDSTKDKFFNEWVTFLSRYKTDNPKTNKIKAIGNNLDTDIEY